MGEVPADETVYTDYQDEQLREPCNMKFKTVNSRLHLWIDAHRQKYSDSNVEWEDLEHQTTMRVSNSLGSLVIRFHKSQHKSANVVLVQGTLFENWLDEQYVGLRKLVDMLEQQQSTQQTHRDGAEDLNLNPNDLLSAESEDIESNGSVVLQSDGEIVDDDVSVRHDVHIPHGDVPDARVRTDTNTLNEEDVSLEKQQETVSGNAENDKQVLDTVQNSYIKLCDRNNTVIDEFRSEVQSVGQIINQLPKKIVNLLKN